MEPLTSTPLTVYIRKKKKYTNFEEILSEYKDYKFNIAEEEKLINDLETVFKYYKEKKTKIEKEIEDDKKLYLFRFQKAKEMIQIYKIFEIQTEILFNLIEYHKNSNPSCKQDENLLVIKEKINTILNFKKKEEDLTFKKDPELDIKFFADENVVEKDSQNSIKNTLIKTLNDNFEMKKDCHLIKNNALNFIPQLEINFDDNIEITKEMVFEFKKELEEIFEDKNFSIIEVNKGSIHFFVSLQFIFKKCLTINDNLKTIFEKIKDRLSKYAENIKKKFFCFYRKETDSVDKFVKDKKANSVNEFVKDINSLDSKEIIGISMSKLNGKKLDEKTNFYEASKAFTVNDFNELIDCLSKEDLVKQECEQLIKNYGEYYDIFEREFEKALAFSIFEYQLVKIYTVDRDDSEKFKAYKTKCPNVEEKLLFHGTKEDHIVSILKTFINIDRNKTYKLGKGFYLSDLFEVSWRYRSSNGYDPNIPKIGDSFSILICNTFYSKNHIEHCYKEIFKDETIPMNHLRFAKAKSNPNEIISENELKNYKNYFQNEYLLSHQEQILPIYAICLRRVEYLIVWRDNNFNVNNPNNYQNFDKMIEFNKEMKNFAYRELNSKIYYVKTTEEGLKLIDRKKYNKIIIITNGGNNGEDFIKESRKIIGANSIAYVTCYIPKNHINWVSKLKNTLLSNDEEIFKDFLKNAITENKIEMKKLKTKIENKYQKRFCEFNEDSIFNFPKFMKEGNFEQLEFDPKYNK